MGLFKKKSKEAAPLYEHLEKAQVSLGSKLRGLFKKEIFDGEFYENLEEDLIMADVSLESTLELVRNLQKKLSEKGKKISQTEALAYFEKTLEDLLPENNFDIDENNLNIIFVFGVNGVGKTTSIAKLSTLFKSQGLSIIVAAADTYRAAAVDQLDTWCSRVGVPLVKHTGKSKPSAVIYDALEAAIARKAQVLIVDTAGRLHNRESLMQELSKLNKILSDKAPNALKYNLLIVDATTGQNAVSQAKNFNESIGINGVFLSKMDSTAKGGIALTLAHQLSIPVVFLGTGEKPENIEYFDKERYVKSVFE